MISFTRLIVLSLFIVAFGSQSLLAKKTTIRFATLAPEGSTWMTTMRALNEDLQQATDGELSFKFFPNMSMGDEKDVIRKMRFGQINAAGFTGFGLGEILPEIRILELPYLFENDAEIDHTYDALTNYFNQALNDKGFVLLGWADVGWIYFLSNKPVAAPEHLKNLKVWMWEGDPLAEAFFKELGKSPVPLSITDVHLSLQTGLIDAVYCSPLAALVLQWFTKVNFISDIPFTNALGAVLIEKKTFDKLSPAHQTLLLEKSRQRLKELVATARMDNREAYDNILKQGLEQAVSTPEQRAAMKSIGLKVHRRLAGDLYPETTLVRLNEILAEYRSKHNNPEK